METIMKTPRELEYLEGLVKLSKKKKIEEIGKKLQLSIIPMMLEGFM
jgi:hypothetical protein